MYTKKGSGVSDSTDEQVWIDQFFSKFTPSKTGILNRYRIVWRTKSIRHEYNSSDNKSFDSSNLVPPAKHNAKKSISGDGISGIDSDGSLLFSYDNKTREHLQEQSAQINCLQRTHRLISINKALLGTK